MVTGLVSSILSITGISLDQELPIMSAREELRGTVDILHRDGSVVKDDRDRLGGLLDLHELEVSDVMIHRTNMESIDIDTPTRKIVSKIIESPYTRLPVWQE